MFMDTDFSGRSRRARDEKYNRINIPLSLSLLSLRIISHLILPIAQSRRAILTSIKFRAQ